MSFVLALFGYIVASVTILYDIFKDFCKLVWLVLYPINPFLFDFVADMIDIISELPNSIRDYYHYHVDDLQESDQA